MAWPCSGLFQECFPNHNHAWLRFGKTVFILLIVMTAWDFWVFTGRLLGNVKVFTVEFAYIAIQHNSG